MARHQLISFTALAGLAFAATSSSQGSATPTNPIKVAATSFIADHQYSTTCGWVDRDGGYQGKIGGWNILFFADSTTYPNEHDALYNTSGNGEGFAANTIANLTSDPSVITDLVYNSKAKPGPRPYTFCSPNDTDYPATSERLHLANLLPVDGQVSVAWYQNLYGNESVYECGGNGCVVAGGAVQVAFNGGNLTCKTLVPFWNGTQEPAYGAIAAIGPEPDGYMYLLGQMDKIARANYNDHGYLARVTPRNAFNYSAYQYWNGSAYTSQRLVNPNATQAVTLNLTHAGSWFWSNYYKKYILINVPVHSPEGLHTSSIDALVADRPEGPYSAPVQIYDNTTLGYEGGFYSPSFLTSFDPTGQNVTFIASSNSTIRTVVKLTFA